MDIKIEGFVTRTHLYILLNSLFLTNLNRVVKYGFAERFYRFCATFG